MDGSTQTSFLGPLLAVLLGGLLSLAGGWLQHSWQSKAGKKQKEKEKFEELMLALFEHERWLEIAYQVRVRGRELSLPTNPIAKVSAIASAYFPRLHFDVTRFKAAANSYDDWMLDFAERQSLRKTLGPPTLDGYAQRYEAYLKAFNDLRSRLNLHADEDFT